LDILSDELSSASYFIMLPNDCFVECKDLILTASWPGVRNLEDMSLHHLIYMFKRKGKSELERRASRKFQTSSLSYISLLRGFSTLKLLKSGIAALSSSLETGSSSSAMPMNDVSRPKNFDDWCEKLHKCFLVKKKRSDLNEFKNYMLRSILGGGPSEIGEMQLLVLHRAWILEDHVMASKIGRHDTSLEHIHLEAQKLDKSYACMVHGACTKVPLVPDIWCPHESMDSVIPIGKETESFFRGMWKSLGSIAAIWHAEKTGGNKKRKAKRGKRGRRQFFDNADDSEEEEDERSGKELAKYMKHGVKYAKDLWEQTKVYRISDAVMMAEKQVIMRLYNEGYLPQLARLQHDTLTMGFLLRRHEFFSVQFASAVAKRLCTERLCATGKASIQVLFF
jgi:hypothetical protein